MIRRTVLAVAAIACLLPAAVGCAIVEEDPQLALTRDRLDERQVSMTFDQARLSEVFEIISIDAGVPIHVDPEVYVARGDERDINMRLTGISAARALDLVCELQMLEWTVHPDGTVVVRQTAGR